MPIEMMWNLHIYGTTDEPVTSTGEASCAQGSGNIPVSHQKLAISIGKQVDYVPQSVYRIFPLSQRLRHPPIYVASHSGRYRKRLAIQEEDVPCSNIPDLSTNILLSLFT
jgi:hypothetical protein